MDLRLRVFSATLDYLYKWYLWLLAFGEITRRIPAIVLTGDFTDGFGNKMRVLAVANPKISFAEYRRHVRGRSQGLADRMLKADGYGIVRVDKQNRQFVLECWPWNSGPETPGTSRYAGWPYVLSFDGTDGRKEIR